MSRDVMPRFDLYQPDTVDGALELAHRLGPDAWILAGGNDSLDWFKDRVKRPSAVIEIAGIRELARIEQTPQGLSIGALTTLTALESHPLVQGNYSLLAMAARSVGSPQLRNASTLGGNLCQDTRCWYYRRGMDCYRAGGSTCYANTPQGQDREHCLYGASRCVAVSPSDVGTASVALDAEMVIRRPGGERVVPAKEFFVGPATDITRMTVLQPGEILTAVRYPGRWAGARFYFEKVADRAAWDFALVSIAAAMKLAGGVIEEARFACGGVECVPRRLEPVERLLMGSRPGEEPSVSP
jgi:xanthine dehydrogenase YagS FAD-binding subunit